MNRRLIRPEGWGRTASRSPRETLTSRQRPRKPIPAEHTSAENFYYVKRMGEKTRMVILLEHGEEIRGTIEWYDRDALKVHRTNAPNILLMKSAIKYMYKEDEARGEETEE